MKKRVLVLGGSYFVGKKIAMVLNDYGYEVSILNRGTKPCPVDGIKQIVCDRNDAEKMKEALKDKHFEYVVDVSWNDVSWVKKLCDALCFDRVVNFIFISSSAVYDVEHLNIPYIENDSLNENKYWTFYGKSKIDAEAYYRDFFNSKDTNLIILRPPYIYGEDNYAQRESLIFKLVSEGSPVIIPKSNPKLQFIYSQDLAKIINVLFNRVNEKIEIYNVGNNEFITTRQWVQKCANIANYPANIIECDYETLNRNVRDFFPFFDYDNVLDVNKINTIVTEETSFEKGISNAYVWYKANKSHIAFKSNVGKNIYEIIAQLNN